MDAAAVPMALLDASGRVVEVNAAWHLHVGVSSGFDARVAPGASYLGACRRAAEEGDHDASLVADGLESVLDGTRPSFEIAYPSPSPWQVRWTHARFSPLLDPDGERWAVAVLVDVTDRWHLSQAVHRVEGLDPSTGLPTADKIEEHLAAQLLEARRSGGRVALAVVALDGRSEVARSHGAPAAEHLLVQAVSRVRRAVRADDVLLRRGDDELVLVARGLGPNGFEALMSRLRAVVREPYHLAGRTTEVAASVGGTLSSPFSTVRSLLDDVARSVEEVPDGAVDAERGVALGAERQAPAGATDPHLPTAPVGPGELGEGDLRIAFRPVVRLEDQMVVGAELVAAVDLPTGAVVDLHRTATVSDDGDRTVRRRHAERCLDTAIDAAARLQRSVPEQPISLVVGVVSEQLIDPQFVHGVRARIERAGLSAARLAIQVTEEELSRSSAAAHASLVGLKALGVRLSISDFGGGHLSLAELSRLPIDVVRADLGALAAEPGEAAAMAAVLAVAQTLGFRAIATGIVDLEDLVELTRLGCSYGEGPRWPDVASIDALESQILLRLAEPNDAGAVPDDREASGTGPSVPPAQGVEELDTVFRSLVHEVRTPLTVAMGWASMLEASPDEQSAVAATSIRRAAERINRLLGNLEDIRMIDQGTLRLETRTLDLRAVVEDVVTEMREVMGTSVAIREDDGFAMEVSADESRITQVLINLISNAAKFSSASHVVEVRLWVDAGWAEVSVVDDGPGVPPEDLAVIFRKYGRGSADRPGSGLGLYLARGIALAHGGNVTYRRRVLRSGSVFTLRLPLVSPR